MLIRVSSPLKILKPIKHTIPGAAPVVKGLVKEFMAQPGSSSIRMSSRLKLLHKQQRKKAFASSAERKRKRKFVKKTKQKDIPSSPSPLSFPLTKS